MVTAPGAKLWRLDHRFDGRRKQLSPGRHPYVSLAKAPRKADEMRRLLAENRDPSTERRMSCRGHRNRPYARRREREA